MINDIKKLLFSLSENDCIGNITDAADLAIKELSKYCEAKKENGNIIGFLKGKSDYTVLLDAHIDEVGFTVTDIDENGFLTVSACGGTDKRSLPAKQVKIHGKETVAGVFCSTPPHLKSSELDFTDMSAFKIDSTLGSKAKDIISVGDYVTYLQKPACLLGDCVTGKALDNRIGVCVLLETAKRLYKKELPVNVCFLLSTAEELGLRGAKTAAFGLKTDEAAVIDVTFGNAPDVSGEECGNLGSGSMVGISPILSKEIGEKMISLAKQNNIPYAVEVMNGKTGTNADVISLDKSGVKTVTLSVPIRNMHTPAEVADMRDILSACDILEKYILSGGIDNE